jgi:hypothetical protein
MKQLLLLFVPILMGLQCFSQSKKETDSSKKVLNDEINALAKKMKEDTKKLSDLNQVIEPVQNPQTTGGGNTIYRYNAQVLSTNFTVPILRVNYLTPVAAASANAKASASFFNSIGAGIGYYFGKLERTLDNQNNLVTQDMTNIFGIQIGCLFAANGGTANASSTTTTSGSTTTTTTANNGSTNIFAVTGAISILNFQVGAGYELGTIVSGQRRGFMTIAYSIPLYALAKGSFIVAHKKPIPSTNVNDYQYQLQ